MKVEAPFTLAPIFLSSMKRLIEGLDVRDPSVRMLDQSRIGAILTGDDGRTKGRGARSRAHRPKYKSGFGRAGPDQSETRFRSATTSSSASTSSS